MIQSIRYTGGLAYDSTITEAKMMYRTIALQPCLLSISLSIVALRYSSSHPRYAAAFSPPLQRIHSTFPCTHDNALERSNTNDNRPMCSSGIRIDGINIDGVCHVSLSTLYLMNMPASPVWVFVDAILPHMSTRLLEGLHPGRWKYK